ncbi:MAG: type VI toxin-antitoxin system SocA family antitoxin [Alphaproteobacteria bacterium]
MASQAPFDARAVANTLLSLARQQRRPLTHLALQKLLYFAHAKFLIEQKKPLVTGYFEAWQYGPVHPAVYQAFRTALDQPINFLASKKNPITGDEAELGIIDDEPVQILLTEILFSFGRMTSGRLVEISHAPDAPWHYVVNKSETSLAFGARIPENVIVERFKHHKVSVAIAPRQGEPLEDTPPS